ncbi:transposon Tf2-6 polyprotein [Trichonephila clavata]|uniref:Transposon Tf2-6 polyprotein n=1 Tax=Trichonephila clavata TaxID=2740835 RepID=A0A8X6HJZ6_TRICU|nr:transposon Tf2-6 polyprotein [Trichonephila clavata]
MLELFLQQLPTSVQTILASITPITVEKAAEVADRILEVSILNVSLSTNAIASSSENRIIQEIERLNRRIDDLTMRQRLQSEEIILARKIIPEIDHFPVPGNLGFVWYHRKFSRKGQEMQFTLLQL